MTDRSAVLGVLATLAIGTGLGLIVYGLAGEWRAYRRLSMVDATRAILRRRDLSVEAARTTALAWVRLVATGIPNAAAVEQAISAATVPAVLNAVLRERVAVPLHTAAMAIGRRAALEGGTLIALSPHPSWDGVVAGGAAIHKSPGFMVFDLGPR